MYKYDLSVPIGEMYNLVEETRRRVAGQQDVKARPSNTSCAGQSQLAGLALNSITAAKPAALHSIQLR